MSFRDEEQDNESGSRNYERSSGRMYRGLEEQTSICRQLVLAGTGKTSCNEKEGGRNAKKNYAFKDFPLRLSIMDFDSKYTRGPFIESGSFGEVCRVSRKSDGVEMALKTIYKSKLPHYAGATQGEYPFEVELLRNLDHPHIIKFMDSFEDAKSFLLVMELVTNSIDLYDFTMKRVETSEEVLAYLFAQVADALLFLHCHDIAHLDIKLENVVMDENLNCDFHGKDADCWALGVLLYRLCYRETPFISRDEALSLDYVLPDDISPELDDLFSRVFHETLLCRAEAWEVRHHPWTMGGDRKGYSLSDLIIEETVGKSSDSDDSAEEGEDSAEDGGYLSENNTEQYYSHAGRYFHIQKSEADPVKMNKRWR
ncbi:kinase domain protein [Ancylostoma ceylanicum]|uniref:Kinase domain protein n=1 Tax=Ancylostoma ceylanicum TaxID=53326 RepID=A0A0D6MCY2_9BILA|nr:kinase domain protein [Ancylostoma ceylanicum]